MGILFVMVAVVVAAAVAAVAKGLLAAHRELSKGEEAAPAAMAAGWAPPEEVILLLLAWGADVLLGFGGEGFALLGGVVFFRLPQGPAPRGAASWEKKRRRGRSGQRPSGSKWLKNQLARQTRRYSRLVAKNPSIEFGSGISPELCEALRAVKALSLGCSYKFSRGFNLPALKELEKVDFSTSLDGEWTKKEVADLREFFLNWCCYLAWDQLMENLQEVLHERWSEIEASASKKHRKGTQDWYRAVEDQKAQIERVFVTEPLRGVEGELEGMTLYQLGRWLAKS